MTDATAIIEALDRRYEPIGVREADAHVFTVSYGGVTLRTVGTLIEAHALSSAVNRAVARERELLQQATM